MSATARFPIGAILSVIGERLVCDLDHLYGLLEHLLDRPLLTHQMPAAADAVAPWLREQFPGLAAIPLDSLGPVIEQAQARGGSDAVRAEIHAWLTGLGAAIGPSREVGRPDPVPTPDLDTRALNLLAQAVPETVV